MTNKELKTINFVKMLTDELKIIDASIINQEEELQSIKEYRRSLNGLLSCEPYKSLIGKTLYAGTEAEPIDFKILPTKLRTAFSSLGFNAWGDVTHCPDLMLKMRSLRGIGRGTIVLLITELASKGLKLKDE